MDLFERAHIPRKSSFKMENKVDEAVKRQLKQMMHAYKKGNNPGIVKSSELKPKYDIDEILSVSDFSEFSMSRRADNTMDTATSHTSDDLQSISNENNSSKSNTDENTQDSLEDINECSEEAISASSVDVSQSISLGNSSALFESSDSDDSELSIPSSLQISTGSGTDASIDEEFDADGTLASKILQKLDKKDNISIKRKIPKPQVELEIRNNDYKIKQKHIKNKEKTQIKNKKPKQETHNNSTEYFLEEDFSSDIESGKQNQILQEMETELILNETRNKKKPKQKQPQQIDLSNDSTNSDSLESVATSISAPFISVSAEDMSSQSLDELLGDYVHPTIRNLSMDRLNITGRTSSSMFPADTMKVKDIIDDEISSLIPEVDEELAIEDLNLDTDTQELIEESNSFNNIIRTEVLSPEDMITETSPSNDTIVDEVSIEEETVPMKLYNGNNLYVLVMKHPAELHIHGKVQIADINRMTEIFGFKLNYDSIDVYAPYSHFAQCLKTLEYPHEANSDLHSELTLAGLSVTDANEIVSNIEENSAVIILSKLNSCKLDFVDHNFNVDLFSKRCDNTPRFLKKAAESLGCSFYLKPPKRSFEEKAIWDDIYSNSKRNGSRGIICGGKGTGKSTFLRHYVNTLLGDGPVLVIDLDPGQAEFTVPGSISATIVDRPLIGPNFTHLKTPEKMLNIGIINTMENAKRYLSAVTELVNYCRANEDFRELPWIVNTMGLCNHMGLKFMTYIILQIKPTFLYQIDSKVPKKRFEVELDHLTVINLYEQYSNDRSFRNVENPYSIEYSFVIARHQDNAPLKGNAMGSSLQPRDERYLNILAYFGELMNNRLQGLLEIVPYQVSMKDLNIGLNVKIPGDSVTKVINGKIVALCQQKEHDKSKVFTLGDKALLCHGHGLIRSIDYEQGILYVLTPTPIGKLNLVDTLVYSDWMPELRGQERELPSGTSIPYRTANTPLHHRKLMFPPRRRFNPLQLLKMSRNS